jgi:hypothetical protein
LLASEIASALIPAELQQMVEILDAFPIEVSEVRASPKQIQFQANFFNRADPDGRRCDIFVAMGGNRSGKSIVCGRLCFAKYLRDHARNGDWFWCVGQTLDRSINGQQKELWEALPRWMFGGTTWNPKIGFGMHRKIQLPTQDGGRCLIEFRSGDQDASTFEQAKLSGVWCDERLPEAIYDRLLPRIIDKDGWILYSDIPEQWWQYERLANAKPEACVHYQHFRMLDNEHNLPDGAINKVSARMTEDERQQRIHGEFVVMEGIVYGKEYNDAIHAIDPFAIPEDWPKWRLIDYGGSAPTACLWVALAPNERCYVYREYYMANLSVAANAGAIIAMSEGETYRETLMDPHAVDPPPIYYGAARTISQQYADAGIPSTGWPFVNVMGEHSMVQRVKKRLETNMLKVFKTCINHRREFRSWKYKVDKDGKPLAADAFENANNHTLDCIKGFFGTDPCYTSRKIEVV